MSRGSIIAIDFDGTCVEHMYPAMGKNVPGAVGVLQRLVESGHKLILWTMRDNHELTQAKWWFFENQIPLYGVCGNPDQHSWTTSPKAYANLYIDDAALGCPLRPGIQGPRPMVDWEEVAALLIEMNYLSYEA